MKRAYWVTSLLLVAITVLAACAAPAAPVPPTAAPTAVPPTAASTAVPPTAVLTPAPATAKEATLKIAEDATLGKFLADDQGRTLYLFTKDTKNTSVCYDDCAKTWPPLLSAGQPTGVDGINTSLLGTTQRKDGSMQVTYNGFPLYYFAPDQKPGDVKGQGVKDVWYVISPAGEMVKAAVVKITEDAKLGKFLADDQGRTLYLFTNDAKNTSNCYDQCAKAWPPLLSAGQPKGADGVNASLLGTTQRKDGTLQVTYNGYPLYYFAADQKPGDVKGQGVKDVWYLVSPNGEMVKSNASASY